LTVLATSREGLGITGEITYRVPSLEVPDPQAMPPLAELEQNPAVRLFIERAAAVQPQFAVSERNGLAVALVCQRLDGIPLALELAAARIEVLTVEQVAARLDQRFHLLTGGNRVALPRQQTLHATFDWSYELLSEAEQRLFNHLSVFVGGWTLEAAEAVGADDAIKRQDVLDLLQRLVRKSLVIAEAGGHGATRYRMLETLRQYANERLSTAGEGAELHERHARHYLVLAEALGPSMYDWAAGAVDWLLIEHDNLRAALRWFNDSNAVEQAVRLGGQLWGIWIFGGYLTEGRAQLRKLLALPGVSSASPEWGRLAYSHGLVELFLADYAASRTILEGVAAVQRAIADPLLATTLGSIGQAAREQEDYVAARASLHECLALARDLDLQPVVSHALLRLGTVAHAERDFVLARAQLEESLALSRRLDDRIGVAWSMYHMGCLALDQDDYRLARAWLSQGLDTFPAFDRLGLTHSLAGFANLAAAEGQPVAALRLTGATVASIERTGIPLQHIQQVRHERWLATARQALSEDLAAAVWAEGHAMTLEEAITYALAPRDPAAVISTPPKQAATPTSNPLTPRQREVAVLIAQGLTNREIAERLVVTERGAAAHVEQIMVRLGARSRAQIAVWASEHGLLATRSD
jgi:non-specific serine/threonine protein kinase